MGHASQVGHECKLYYNSGTHASPTWVEVKKAIDVSSPLTKAKADASRRESKFHFDRGGTREVGVEFGYRYKPTRTGADDTVFDALQDSWENDTPLQFFVADGDAATPGTQGIRAFCIVFDFGYDQNMNETQVVNVAASLTDWEEASALIEPDWYEVT